MCISEIVYQSHWHLSTKKQNRKENGDIYGYTGQIQVKTIDSDRIAMTFEVNKGAPNYNSGSFVDTMLYNNNKAVYTTHLDATCKISFYFKRKGITVKQEAVDYNSGCDFGHAVVADGFFNRTSKKTPILVQPLTGEKL